MSTSVIWQQNPHTSSILPTWTYGNYGGQGWTGGRFTPPGEAADFAPDPTDKLDAVFRDHDDAYGKRSDAWNESPKTPADIAQYWQDTIAADQAMRESINALIKELNQGWDPVNITGALQELDMRKAAADANNIFVFKELLDQKNLRDLKNPDGTPYQETPNPDGSIPEDPWFGHLPNDPVLKELLKDLRETTPRDQSNLDAIKQQTQTAATIPSPIILDLDGDGLIGTVGLGAGVHFDHAAEGFAERTGWVAPGDGLLVWDRNANGTIDTGRELLGSETLLPNGLKAVNGFEALAALDANGDGIIDANDPVYAELRVWVDVNLDGRTGEGELLTLEEAGVRSIHVAYTNSTHVDAQGNAHRQVGSYTTTEGQTRLATDVWFQVKRSAANDAQWIQAA